MRLGLESVPEASHSDDSCRARRIRLDLGAKPSYVSVDEPNISVVVVSPDGGENLLTGEHPTRLVGKGTQQPEFCRRQPDLLAVEPDAAFIGRDA
jgi:hypothetical protein